MNYIVFLSMISIFLVILITLTYRHSVREGLLEMDNSTNIVNLKNLVNDYNKIDDISKTYLSKTSIVNPYEISSPDPPIPTNVSNIVISNTKILIKNIVSLSESIRDKIEKYDITLFSKGIEESNKIIEIEKSTGNYPIYEIKRHIDSILYSMHYYKLNTLLKNIHDSADLKSAQSNYIIYMEYLTKLSYTIDMLQNRTVYDHKTDISDKNKNAKGSVEHKAYNVLVDIANSEDIKYGIVKLNYLKENKEIPKDSQIKNYITDAQDRIIDKVRFIGNNMPYYLGFNSGLKDGRSKLNSLKQDIGTYKDDRPEKNIEIENIITAAQNDILTKMKSLTSLLSYKTTTLNTAQSILLSLKDGTPISQKEQDYIATIQSKVNEMATSLSNEIIGINNIQVAKNKLQYLKDNAGNPIVSEIQKAIDDAENSINLKIAAAYSTTPASTTAYSTTPASTTYSTTPTSTTYSTTPASTTYSTTPASTTYSTTPASTTYSTTPASTTYSTTPASTTYSTTPASTTYSTTPASTAYSTTPASTAYSTTPESEYSTITDSTYSTTPASTITDSMYSTTPASTTFDSTPASTAAWNTPKNTLSYSSYPSTSMNPNEINKYDMYLDKNIIKNGDSVSSYMSSHTPGPQYTGIFRQIVEKETILDFFKNIFLKYSMG